MLSMDAEIMDAFAKDAKDLVALTSAAYLDFLKVKPILSLIDKTPDSRLDATWVLALDDFKIHCKLKFPRPIRNEIQK